jgi:integrase/recombinase XerD
MLELAVAIAQYIQRCGDARRLSAHTISAYEIDLRQFSSEMALEAETGAAAVRACLTKIAENKKFSPRTVKRKIASVRAFLRVTDEKLAFEVFSSWKISVRAPLKLPRTLENNDLSAILTERASKEADELVGYSTTHLCLSLMAATGLRVSELCSLRIASVRPQTGEIMVFGKGARERVVIVANAKVRRLLAGYVATLSNYAIDSPLFYNARRRPLTPQCLRLRLHSLAKRVRVGRIVTPHMFRHTAATLLLEGGVDIRFVQRLLGHASISTTQIYTHVSDKALRGALERADVMKAFA